MAKIRSKKINDRYIMHYNEYDQQVGYSEIRTLSRGLIYMVHFDKNGKQLATSEERENIFSKDNYIVHIDNAGKIIGTSEVIHPLIGSPYINHTNTAGKSIGTSEIYDPIFGTIYVGTDITIPKPVNPAPPSSPKPYDPPASGGYSGGYVSVKPRGFYVSFDLSIAENLGILFITAIVMFFATRHLYQLYTVQPMLFYQAISVYAVVSPIICLLVLHKKYESKDAGKIAIWLMAIANGALIIYETKLLGALLYPGSIYHFSDFASTIRYWIPLAIHGLISGIITAIALRKNEDQKLYIRKVSAGFRIHAICSFSAIYAVIIYMADTIGDTSGWFGWTLEIILVLIFTGVLSTIATFISNIPYLIFCKYSEE